MFNLKPNANGVIETTLENLQNFSSIYLVACDQDSVVSRNVNVQSILKNDEAGLMIPSKDLTQKKKI